MICAIGVKPEACAIAYSLALRSLVKNGELAAPMVFRRSSAPSGIPPRWMRSRSTAAAWRSSSLSGVARFPNRAKATHMLAQLHPCVQRGPPSRSPLAQTVANTGCRPAGGWLFAGGHRNGLHCGPMRSRHALSLRRSVVLSAAVGMLTFAPVSDGASIAAPVPTVTGTVRPVRIDGHERLLLTSIGVYGIGNLKLSVGCVGGCLRYPGPIRVSHPRPGAKLFRGTNWVLAPGRAVRIAIYHKGVIGRYLVLGARLKRKPHLVLRRSGCLDGAARVTACPRGITQPKSGTVVAASLDSTTQERGFAGTSFSPAPPPDL